MSITSPAPEELHEALKGRYTAVWPSGMASERNWMLEVFGPYIKDEIFDPERVKPAVDHAIVFDIFPNAYDRNYYRQYRGLDAFIVDMRDENFDTDADLYANFRGVIRNHWSDVFRKETVQFLPLGYTEGFTPTSFPKASERQYVWSFVGQANKSTRPDMLRALAPIEPHLIFTTDELSGSVMWNRIHGSGRRYNSNENAAVLRSSIFAPSPMGNVNLDCFRVYEALESGCIPIVERRATLDYFREALGNHPMPTVRSWPEARTLIASIINDTAALEELQLKCVQWWQGYKAAYRLELEAFLTARSAAPGVLTANDIVLPKRFTRWWKPVELLRHHDARAIARRVRRMSGRLLSGQKLRQAAGAPR